MTEEDGEKTYTLDPKKVTNQPRVLRAPAAWAREGNDDPIPVNKIPGLHASIITSGEFLTTRLPSAFIENVQEMKDQVGSIIIILGQLEKRIRELEERK